MPLVHTYAKFSQLALKFSFGFHVKNINLRKVLVLTKSSYCKQALEKVPSTMKLTSELFQSVVTEDVKFIHELFKKYGFELRIAGGAVRDLLSGIAPTDLDFATTATPEEMRDIFNKNEIRLINLKGESHGTITARINDVNYEITTLRIDKETDGRHAIVEFTKSWYQDASRRDLTINAMFLDLEGTVYDYFDGAEHLKERKILFVGDPSDRIREDYLRILRYFRFHGRISENPDEHDEITLNSIRDNAKGLKQISGERIQGEIFKILSGNNGIPLLKKILSLGIGDYIGLPNRNYEELNRVSDVIQKHNFIVTPVTILSALFENESDVERFSSRIKTSAYHRDLAYFIVEQRNKGSSEPISYYQKMTIFSKNSKLMKCAVIEYLMYMGEVDILNEYKDWEIPKFPVGGYEIEAKIPQHRRSIGIVKNQLLTVWVDSNFNLKRDEIINLIPEVAGKCVSPVKTSAKTKERRRIF